MKRLLISGLALAILTGGALAQVAAPAGGIPPMAGMKAPPPGAGPDAMMDDAGAPPPPGGPRGGPGGPGGPGRPGDRRPPPPPSKAAHFRLERGDVALDVKCAEDEPMKACGDLTLQLLDRLQATSTASTPKP